jgi:hypothetical protein
MNLRILLTFGHRGAAMVRSKTAGRDSCPIAVELRNKREQVTSGLLPLFHSDGGEGRGTGGLLLLGFSSPQPSPRSCLAKRGRSPDVAPRAIQNCHSTVFSSSPSRGKIKAQQELRPTVWSSFQIKRSLLAFLLLVCLADAFAVIGAIAQQPAGDEVGTFFMGRLKHSDKDGNDCGGASSHLMQLVSKASSLKMQQEKRIKYTDPELYETPFLFMNGHNDFVLTAQEIEILKKYLAHGGFLFASGCCTNPEFPKAWRREFSRIFGGEAVKPLPYDHLIYRSFHKIERVRSLHANRDIHLEGLYYQGNLVAVLGEDGLCCAFSMGNKCNDGKGVSAEDGQKLALNIAVYALTH